MYWILSPMTATHVDMEYGYKGSICFLNDSNKRCPSSYPWLHNKFPQNLMAKNHNKHSVTSHGLCRSDIQPGYSGNNLCLLYDVNLRTRSDQMAGG